MRSIALILIVAAAGCTKVYNSQPVVQNPVSPTTTPATPADLIEFRVFGVVGNAPVAIKYTDSVDGLTAAAAASLPYVATVRSADDFIFLYLEAQSSPTTLLVTPNLQVQIYVNGKLFREGFASGSAVTLVATAAGTFRRDGK